MTFVTVDQFVLVFANKQDLPNAMNVNEITERLGLNQLGTRVEFKECWACRGKQNLPEIGCTLLEY